MRRTLLLFAVFGLAGSLWAADPIIGTWKLNVAKSKAQALVKERTEVYREVEGDRIELKASEIRPDGSSSPPPSGEGLTWPRQGGLTSRNHPAMTKEDIWVQTLIAPGHWCVTFLENGKQVGLIHKVISKDGKTMTQLHKGVDQGKPYEMVWVFDRQ